MLLERRTISGSTLNEGTLCQTSAKGWITTSTARINWNLDIPILSSWSFRRKQNCTLASNLLFSGPVHGCDVQTCGWSPGKHGFSYSHCGYAARKVKITPLLLAKYCDDNWLCFGTVRYLIVLLWTCALKPIKNVKRESCGILQLLLDTRIIRPQGRLKNAMVNSTCWEREITGCGMRTYHQISMVGLQWI